MNNLSRGKIMQKKFIIALGLTLALSACSNIKQTLGLVKQGPDEFTVITRAPLTVPPNFELTPPKPGAPRPQETTAAQIALNAISSYDENQSVSEQNSISAGEQALLSMANTNKADPDIRRLIAQDESNFALRDKNFAEKLVFWQEQANPSEVLVDPAKESKRIQDVQALGEPITQGETPIIAREKKGFLEGLF